MFGVMVHAHHGPATGLEPGCTEGGEHGGGVVQVVQHLHGHEQIEATFWRPIGKHGVVVVTPVNALGLLNHRRRTVHPFGVGAEGHRGELTTTQPLPHPTSMARKLRPSSAVRVSPKASISPTAGAWPRSMPSSRPSMAQSLNTSTAGRTSVMRVASTASHHLGGANTITLPTGCRGMADLDDVLYPTIEPHDEGMLEVTDLHTVVEVSGNPEGAPVLVIHGGPGGGSQPDYRRYFDPNHWRIVQFDARLRPLDAVG